MALKIRRGTDTERQTITPDLGEPIFTTDTKQLFVGDGSTVGGVLVSTPTGEYVQDLVAEQLVTNGTHSGITFSYDDAGDGAIDASVSINSSTSGFLSGIDNHLNTSSATIGQLLQWDGSDYDWVAAPITYGDGDVDAHLNQSNPTAGYVLSWNGSDYSWVAQTSTYSSFNSDFDSRLSTKSTDNLSEGSSNLYYTDARVDTRITASNPYTSSNFNTDFASKSTTNLSEGTNLYYTNTRVDAHLNQSNPTAGYVLSWNGSDYAWVVQSGGISSLFDDKTPQLGGNLDLNARSISGVGSINIIGNITTGSTNTISAGTVSGTTVNVNVLNATVGEITVNGDMSFIDNKKIIIGDNDELQIFNDGSKSVIQENGGGNLRISGSEIEFMDDDQSDYYARFIENGAATLYHSGSPKLSTSSIGVSITGRITGLTNPTSAQDAATKSYVDANIGSGVIAVDVGTSLPSSPVEGQLFFYEGASAGDTARILIYTNNNWVIASPGGSSSGGSSYGNSDVDAHLNRSTAASGQVLSWNGSDYAWVAQSSGSGSSYTHPNHTGDVTSVGDGATTIIDNVINEAKLRVSNGPVDGYVLTSRPAAVGGLTWEAASGGISLSEARAGISVSTGGSVSGGALSYNSSTGVLTFNPAAAGGSSYGDTDVDTHLNRTSASAGQVLSWNGSDYAWVAQSSGSGSGDITAVVAGTGLTGGATSGSATLNVDVGTTAGKIVQLDNSAKLPAIDGSNLTNVQASSVLISESIDDNVNYNILFSDTTGSGGIQMTPVQDAAGLTFNPSANILSVQKIAITYLPTTPGGYISFEGTTNDNYETFLYAENPTADNVIYLPNKSGTIALTSDIGSGGSYSNLDVDAHLNRTSSTSAGYVLSWNGTDYAWVAQSSGSGGGVNLQSNGNNLTVNVDGQNIDDSHTSTLNFTGDGVSISGTGATKNINISGLQSRDIGLTATGSGEFNSDITGYKAYMLMKIQTSGAAWVRIYTSSTARTADVNSGRTQTSDPTPDAGVIAEVITNGAETVVMSPGVLGFNESISSTDIPIRVSSLASGAPSVTVTLTALQLEA